jgi:carboxylesterase type B
MVVVDFNYRVGPWGFLASKEVQANGDLNAGLLDQRFVLQWVQRYIHLFGGDPKRVVLGGASAGAASVDIHMSAYGGRNDGLFIAVAAESQSFGSQMRVEDAQYQYDGLVQRTGCGASSDTLACLRKTDISVLAKNNAAMPIPGGAGGNPVFPYSGKLLFPSSISDEVPMLTILTDVIDGDFIREKTYDAYANARYIRVPAIFGDVTNEGTLFTPAGINNYNDVNNFLKNNFVKLTASQLAQIDFMYPKAETFAGGTYWRTAANVYGDMRYTCPGIWMATILDRDSMPVYLYNWDIASAKNIANGLGVTHTDESNSIWGTAQSLPQSASNSLIQGYWQSFIRTGGDPNALRLAGSPEWGTLDRNNQSRMHFVADPKNSGMAKIPAAQNTRCNYLTTIGGSLGQK